MVDFIKDIASKVSDTSQALIESAKSNFNQFSGYFGNSDKGRPTSVPSDYKSQAQPNVKVGRQGTNDTYQVYQFPEDLGTGKHQHFVMFFINDISESKIVRNLGDKGTYKPQRTQQSFQAVQSGISSIENTTVKSTLKTLGITEGYKQTPYAIALYMPNGLSQQWSASWSELEAPQWLNILTNMSQNAEGVGQAAAAGVRRGLSQGLNAIVDEILGEGAAGKITGKITNPAIEQTFSGIQNRHHNFTFSLAPKNEQEAHTIRQVIRIFQYHMHPERTLENYLIFPSEFEIEFYSGNGYRNEFLGKITTCVLESVSVDYAPTGVWSAFKNSEGIPVICNMTLQFKEVEQLNRNRLEEMNDAPEYVNKIKEANPRDRR